MWKQYLCVKWRTRGVDLLPNGREHTATWGQTHFFGQHVLFTKIIYFILRSKLSSNMTIYIIQNCYLCAVSILSEQINLHMFSLKKINRANYKCIYVTTTAIKPGPVTLREEFTQWHIQSLEHNIFTDKNIDIVL